MILEDFDTSLKKVGFKPIYFLVKISEGSSQTLVRKTKLLVSDFSSMEMTEKLKTWIKIEIYTEQVSFHDN